MKTHKSWIGCTASALLFLVLPSHGAEWPLSKWDKLKHDFNRRVLVDVYRVNAHTNAAWDEPALRLTEAFAMRFSQLPSSPTPAAVLKYSEMAIAAGCDDPLIWYLHGSALSLNGRGEEATGWFAKGLAGMEAAKTYTHIRLSFAHGRLAETKHPATDEAAREHLDRALQEMVAALKADEYRGQEARLWLEQAIGRLKEWEQMGFEPDDLWLRLAGLLRVESRINTWFPLMIEANYRTVLAWKARGTGYMNSVPPDKAKEYDVRMSGVRDLFKMAWKARPDLPEAAVGMLSLCRQGYREQDDTVDLWFGRAVALDDENPHAYAEYALNLLPRWGGPGGEKAIKFLHDCLVTKPYETGIPELFLTYLPYLSQDTCGSSYCLLMRDSVYADARRFLRDCEGFGVATNPLKPLKVDLFIAAEARGDLPAARRFARELGTTLHAYALKSPSAGAITSALARMSIPLDALLPRQRLAALNLPMQTIHFAYKNPGATNFAMWSDAPGFNGLVTYGPPYRGGWEFGRGFMPGLYAYRFIVNGEAMLDSNNSETVELSDGSMASFINTWRSSLIPERRVRPVAITYTNAHAKKVFVTGEFSSWRMDANPMKSDSNGVWRTTLELEPGRYAYKFIVDGEWIFDPAQPARKTVNGTENSALTVPP